MTTPTIFSDIVGTDGLGNAQPCRVDGAMYSLKSVTTIPALTAGAVIAGAVRIKKGDRILGIQIKADDLDTGSAITLDVGIVYDDDSTYTNDVDGFFDGLDILQDAGSRNWPVDDDAEAYVEGIIAAADGYISYTFLDSGSGGTITLGDIHQTTIIQGGA